MHSFHHLPAPPHLLGLPVLPTHLLHPWKTVRGAALAFAISGLLIVVLTLTIRLLIGSTLLRDGGLISFTG